MSQEKATFLWPSKAKVKNETLCSDFEHGGLKDVNIQEKITSLQFPWMKKLYSDSFHELKVTLLFYKFYKKKFKKCLNF